MYRYINPNQPGKATERENLSRLDIAIRRSLWMPIDM